MVNDDVISSKDNTKIKRLRKLHTSKHRRKENRFLIEGSHLIEEAMLYGQDIHQVIITDGVLHGLNLSDHDVIRVTGEVMKTVSTLESPPGIIASVSYVSPVPETGRVLALDYIQDPGNLGTLIRTADAFGFRHVVLSPDSVDPFSDKVLRSAQGSTFHVNIEMTPIMDVINGFNGLTLGTGTKSAEYIGDIPTEGEVLIVLGNEGQGVSDNVLAAVDKKVQIEMPGPSESLNVAIAGGILMHHFKA